ncbi:COP9 signalosome complex subunit 7 [Hibiscus syriacus]|uniref:COP9 signalosome complex subunit 7 n=1 Tax=Hibiscus syriacus TaxID=106335 RepID=A0A6A2WLJ7_HIBSY|nr:COP9 signalosome complex subunit 7 [Hibiscus syriacus]
MEIEEKQAELIDQFVKQASAQKGSALGPVIVEATSHPSLFAFSEILDVPTVTELEGTDNSLMLELDVTNIRQLEDFLINNCMYAGLVRGKLDQLRRYFEVQFAAGRDLRPGQLGSMIQTLSNWLATSDNLLITIQDKIKWADTMSELDKKHRKELEDRVMEVKKSVAIKMQNTEFKDLGLACHDLTRSILRKAKADQEEKASDVQNMQLIGWTDLNFECATVQYKSAILGSNEELNHPEGETRAEAALNRHLMIVDFRSFSCSHFAFVTRGICGVSRFYLSFILFL